MGDGWRDKVAARRDIDYIAVPCYFLQNNKVYSFGWIETKQNKQTKQTLLISVCICICLFFISLAWFLLFLILALTEFCLKQINFIGPLKFIGVGFYRTIFIGNRI